MCWLWPVMGVVDDHCWGGFVVVIIILFYFNLSRSGLVVVAAVGGGWLWLGWLCWWSLLGLGLLGLCLVDLGLLGLGLLGSMVELARWGWRGKWKWNRGAPTVITQSCSGCDNVLVKGPTTSLNLPTCHWTRFLSFENRWNLFFVLVTHIHFLEWQSDENGDSKLIQTSVEFWKQVGPTHFGWWKQKTEWYHSKLSSSEQALNLFPCVN